MAVHPLLGRIAARVRRELAPAGEAPAAPVDLLAVADAARREGRFADAATAFDAALAGEPGRLELLVQSGHMHKEAGQFETAKRAYETAAALAPQDADLALQMGHFYKVAGRFSDAAASYRRAIALDPDGAAARMELDAMHRSGWRGVPPAGATEPALADVRPALLPELEPRGAAAMLHAHAETIVVGRIGRHEETLWGKLRVLRGIEAIRGYCISASPVIDLQIKLNGLLLFKGPLKGFPLKYEAARPEIRKWVFNEWIDFTGFAVGRHELELIFSRREDGSMTWREALAVGGVEDTPELRASDAFVPPFASGDPVLLKTYVNGLPSMIRPGARRVLAEGVRQIAVLRTDQLGDLAVSIAPLRRLRALFPGAILVGLLSPSNASLARTLALFDDIIVVDFPDDPTERRRVMTAGAQRALRDRLSAYDFDLGVDMSESNVSRPLLLLTGARFTFGFHPREFDWISAGMDSSSHDVRNGLERVSHTAKTMAMVEALGALVTVRSEVVRRDDLDRSILHKPFGLAAGEAYAVLHAGARLAHSRWPGYGQLAQLILAHTGLKVVLLSDDATDRDRLAPSLLGSPRFSFVDGKLDFDAFDALLQFCEVFVGNDSGPKHLAALRGAKVVSIHMSRNNWNEWGQDTGGLIISRRVPCAGCVLHHDPEECGQDFACIRHIKPEEVFSAVRQVL